MKHFPLDSECNRFMSRSDQGLACRAALVSIALRGTDKYKPFVDSIMRNNNPLSLPLIEISLANAGVTREKLQRLMSEGEARKILLAEIEEAARFRPDGTPTFVINGRDLPSGLPRSPSLTGSFRWK
jgi:protein-disulfide isomerase